MIEETTNPMAVSILRKQGEVFISRIFKHFTGNRQNSIFRGSFYIDGSRGKYYAEVDYGNNHRGGVFNYYIQDGAVNIYIDLEKIKFVSLEFEGRMLNPEKFRFRAKKGWDDRVSFFKITEDLKGWIVNYKSKKEEEEDIRNYTYISNVVKSILIDCDIEKFK